MIETIIKNLEKGRYLLENISDDKYNDKSLAPYHSSIGGHMRHVLDVFSCIFKGIVSDNCIDLTQRERNAKAENFTVYGLNYMDTIIYELKKIKTSALKDEISLIDNLGDGCCCVKTTLEGVLVQAHSHAIHHFATIGYMLHALNIQLPIDSFGINPTTPKTQKVEVAADK